MTAASQDRPQARGQDLAPRNATRAPSLVLIVCALGAGAAALDPLLAAQERKDFVVTCAGPEGWAACDRTAAEWCKGNFRITARKAEGMRLSGECRPFKRFE
ncbi:hypothetical protein [Mitsuaria sp. 7]|uniref:hypothetical protein n=1 Tax=Mitsuaria sp. 7 TaxID=1658665 RepID=UPI0007DDE215|nr:hypothetical protein [Mitsuaria sp. 7]ANH67274.1 hypothetical protein ABE85_06280 [Mitsuaria sp. 7]